MYDKRMTRLEKLKFRVSLLYAWTCGKGYMANNITGNRLSTRVTSHLDVDEDAYFGSEVRVGRLPRCQRCEIVVQSRRRARRSETHSRRFLCQENPYKTEFNPLIRAVGKYPKCGDAYMKTYISMCKHWMPSSQRTRNVTWFGSRFDCIFCIGSMHKYVYLPARE